jgi:S1-C subfamily serine protease
VLLGSVLVAVLAAGALVGLRLADRGPAPPTRAEVDRAVQRGVQRALQEQREAPPDAATAYRTILPSLVAVVADRASAVPGEGRLGTGVLVSADGSILTALHVVDGATQIQVRYSDGQQATARVQTRQPDSDIAVLLPDRLPEVVVPAVLGGTADVGDAVFAVGNPLGLQGSLTAGVVSAVDRSVPVGAGVTLKGLIQFDAAVNPGNSGGPLLNRDGQVVGIVTALANPARQPYFVGIGFAVPISTAGGAAGGPSI